MTAGLKIKESADASGFTRATLRYVAASITAVFGGADVVLTPLCASPAPLVGDRPNTGVLRSPRRANTSAWLVPWNVIGQPDISVPVGIDHHGLPTLIQLAGRTGDEATLLGLASEIETNRPFPRWTAPSNT